MSRAGFTLMEVVVALAVASLVALAAYQGVAILGELDARATARREAGVRHLAIRRQLVDWLRSARLATDSLPVGFEGHDRVTAHGVPDDVVAFPTLAPGPFRSGRALVRVLIDRDPATSERGLVAVLTDGPGDTPALRTGSGFDRDRGAGANIVELVPEATGLDIRYRFRLGGDPAWFNGWISAVRLPDAAEVRILGDSVPHILRVPILVPIGGGG